MLHLQDQVLQLSLHRQQSVWGDVQALFWVSSLIHFCSTFSVALMSAFMLLFMHMMCNCCIRVLSLTFKLFVVLICPIRVLRLSEDRVGDICNACVLLVKRWKKLPHGSKKNWNHVSVASFHHTSCFCAKSSAVIMRCAWIDECGL